MNRRTFLTTLAVGAPMLALASRQAYASSSHIPVDTFNVAATGEIKFSTFQLLQDKKYSIVIGGLRQYSYYYDGNGQLQSVLADAMYGLKADGSLDYRALGMLIDDVPAVANVERFATHRYVFHVRLTSATRPIKLQINDSEYGDNDFGHSIEIYRGHLKKVPPPYVAIDDEGAE